MQVARRYRSRTACTSDDVCRSLEGAAKCLPLTLCQGDWKHRIRRILGVAHTGYGWKRAPLGVKHWHTKSVGAMRDQMAQRCLRVSRRARKATRYEAHAELPSGWLLGSGTSASGPILRRDLSIGRRISMMVLTTTACTLLHKTRARVQRFARCMRRWGEKEDT